MTAIAAADAADAAAAPEPAPRPAPDPLFGHAGHYNTSWSRHDRAMGTSTFRTVAARLPRLVGTCLRLAWAADRRAAAIVLAAELATGAFTAFGLLAVNGVLRSLLAGGATTARLHAAIPSVLLAAVAAAANRCCSAASTGLAIRLEPKVRRLAQDRLYQCTNDVELLAFQQGDLKDLIDTAQYGASWIEMAIGRLVDLASGVMSLIAVAGVLAVLHPALIVLLPLIVLPGGVAAVKASQQMYRSRLSMLTPNRQLFQLAFLLTNADTAEEIRVHDTGGFLLRHYRRLSDALAAEQDRLARIRIRSSLTAGAATGLATAAAYLLLFALVEGGTIALSAAGAAAYALRTGTAQLSGLVRSINALYELGLYIGDWEAACAKAQTLAIPSGGAPVDRTPELIEVRDVTFSYPEADSPALSGITLSIRAGQTIALVGHNGSGKTTLAKILAGLYLPDAGTVCWDGAPLTTLDRRAVFQHIALLSQGFFCWPFSASANVGIGRHTRFDDTAAVESALHDAGAGFVHELPEGINTLLCKDYDKGVKPSGGQWQKIALARSGHFRDGTLVILDEPTAALDPKAEIDTFDTVRRLLADKTVVMITHRLGSVRHADYIYSLDGGRIAEQGTFEELIAADGAFAKLYRLQASQYVLGEQGPDSSL
ncbi:MAG: ABC transporter ATP-binding protein [Catenulispora sp.]|nr:ABC transporter ATP-binding protein [Catenulispora sp.]